MQATPHSRPSAAGSALRVLDVALLRLRAFGLADDGIIANLTPLDATI